MKTYYEELQELHHRRVYYILFAGALIMLLFSLLDFLVVPEYFTEFLFCRLNAVFAGLVLLLVNYRDRNKTHPLIIGFISYIMVGSVILVMIHRMGGVTSPYYVGLMLTMASYSVLAPLTTSHTIASGFFLVVLYAFTIVMATPDQERFLLEVFANMFFMVSFVFIIATQSWADTKARRHEFQLRVQEDEAAQQLSRQAAVLEREVAKRSQEQAASEERYRLLFNQIADDVVFITETGEILQSNRDLSRQYIGNRPGETLTLYDIVPEAQRNILRGLFREMIATGRPIRDHQLHLHKADGTVIEAEINGNLLQRDQPVVGILLVIRDISIRKEMERKLIETLETRKKTETAAILALAKLSEFRDVTAGHHLERIREYCSVLAVELSHNQELREVMNATYIEDIYHASILHDIGKVSIPDRLLNRDTPLAEHEVDLIRRHTIIGGDVIKEMQEESKGSSFLDMAKHIAYFHHERWDGRGYPYSLMKREIPLAARIMALADTYEEMTAAAPDHPQRAGHQEAVAHIAGHSGLQFDPMVVEAFMTRQEEFRAIKEKFAEY